MSEWISVGEKLPTTGAACWVVCSGHVQHIAYRRLGRGFACSDGYVWETDFDLGHDGIPDDQITHWMPFPKPPEPSAESAR